MKLMHKHVVPLLKRHWQILSDYLDCPLANRMKIEEKHNGDQKKCLTAVLADWTISGTEDGPNDWPKFIEVLNEIMEHEEELADDVSQVLQSLAKAGVQEGQL